MWPGSVLHAFYSGNSAQSALFCARPQKIQLPNGYCPVSVKEIRGEEES